MVNLRSLPVRSSRLIFTLRTLDDSKRCARRAETHLRGSENGRLRQVARRLARFDADAAHPILFHGLQINYHCAANLQQAKADTIPPGRASASSWIDNEIAVREWVGESGFRQRKATALRSALAQLRTTRGDERVAAFRR
jgi:hypothetical protein